MVYMGSKRRLAKYLIPIIMKYHTDGMLYIEPFVGGANLIDKIPAKVRIGCDSNKYLIALLREIRDGWIPNKFYSKEEYTHIKNNKEKYLPHIVGFSGFCHGFSGMFFRGYRGINPSKRNGKPPRSKTWVNNIIKQAPLLKNISFNFTKYNEFSVKRKATIYCDPPYKRTAKYNDDIDHNHFWKWAEDRHFEGHTVYVSEYQAPDHWHCIFEKNMNSVSVRFNNNKTEKLFTLGKNI